MVARVVVLSVRSPVVPNPAKKPPLPDSALMDVFTSWLVACTVSAPVRPESVVTSPTLASVLRPECPVVCVAPPASRPATTPVWLATSLDTPLAITSTSPWGSVTSLPIEATALPDVVTVLWLTVTATPPTSMASELALTLGLEIAVTSSVATFDRLTPSSIVAVRWVASVVSAITTPTTTSPPP